MSNSDYRLSRFSDIQRKNILAKKRKLSKEIASVSSTENQYEFIKRNREYYFKELLHIYDCRCCYCGAPLWIVQADCIEIDHLIPKSSKDESKKKLNDVTNLAISCISCNRGKADLPASVLEKVNPDTYAITRVLARDVNYSIVIRRRFKNDDAIVSFYERLKLGYQRHRLDYVIVTLNDICTLLKKYDSKFKETISKLHSIESLLLLKRNCSPFS